MTTEEQDRIACLRRHCRMYLYGSAGSPELLVNDIARDFYSFALLHLTCTMFITTDTKKDPAGGAFHRILDPMGYSEFLTDIDRILDQPIGKTNLRHYIRSKRNKLATHGSLAFTTQPQAVQEVTFDDVSLTQFRTAMHELDDAVAKLEQQLALLEEQSEESRTST